MILSHFSLIHQYQIYRSSESECAGKGVPQEVLLGSLNSALDGEELEPLKEGLVSRS